MIFGPKKKYHLRNDNRKEYTVKDEHNDSCWHDKHSTGVEFPSGPVLGVVTTEGREPRVSAFVLLTEPFSTVPGKFDGDKSNKCLHHQVNANYTEPGLRKDTVL